MGLVHDVLPLNLREEREHFFQAGGKYDPQFSYSREINPSELTKWGLPKPEIGQRAAELAKGRTLPPINTTAPVDLTYINQRVDEFNQTYQLNPPLKVRFTWAQIARCVVKKSTVTFKIPLVYSVPIFEDLFRHELETHYLRRLNHRHQPFAAYASPEAKLRRTEEGLAGLHTYLHRPDSFMLKSFLNYLAIHWSLETGFAQVYLKLKDLGLSDQKAWLATLRAKRGLTDTSQPGAFTKDICYLEGAIQVWNWLENPDHDPQDLYLGRLALSELETYQPQADPSQVQYPSFFDDLADYRQRIKKIATINHFAELEPYVR